MNAHSLNFVCRVRLGPRADYAANCLYRGGGSRVLDNNVPIITFRAVDARACARTPGKRLPARVALKLLLRLQATSKDSFSRGVVDRDSRGRGEMRENRRVAATADEMESGGYAMGNTRQGNHADSITDSPSRLTFATGKTAKCSAARSVDYYSSRFPGISRRRRPRRDLPIEERTEMARYC